VKMEQLTAARECLHNCVIEEHKNLSRTFVVFGLAFPHFFVS
jgi:hypothetical protein